MHTIGKNKKLIILASAVVLLSLLLAAPVFAEGEAPPEEAVEEPPAAEESPAEQPAAEEPAEAPAGEAPPEEAAETLPDEADEPPLVEEPPAEEPSAPAEEPPAEEPPLEETAVEPAAEEAPPAVPEAETEPADTPSVAEELAESGLTLTGADGEALDLASESSAEAVSVADPYFMVGTTTYRFFESASGCDPYPGDPNCHDGEANPIQAAIDYIQTNGTVPSDRKIYVEGDDYTGNVNIVGSLPNLSTINGLVGVDGSANTTITGDVYFSSLTGGFTLQGFTISGHITGNTITGTVTLKDIDVSNPSNEGISLHENISGAVVLDGVNSHHNSGHGAYIDNSDALIAYNITIKNSYFDDNDNGGSNRYGLYIQTLGKVTMDGVSASRNRGGGIHLNTDFSSLKITDASLISNDGYSAIPQRGLYAITSKKANITLQDVYAGGDLETSNFTVYLETTGNVTVRNANIIHNDCDGMHIDNTAGSGYVKIYDSQFSENGGVGLDVDSKGVVYLSSVKANENDLDGAYINNCQEAGGVCTGKGTVTVTSSKSAGVFGANEFNGNLNLGLSITSGKSISLTNVTADGNTSTGISLNNPAGSGGITLKKTIKSTDTVTYNNSASDNGINGLYVLSNGTIRLEYLVAGGNDYHGVQLDNDGATMGAPGITILYSEIHENGYWGLHADSKGTIALTNVSANKNGTTSARDGVRLWTLEGTSGGVTIKGTKGYTCQFNENTDRGIEIYAKGAVTLSNVEANGNVLSSYVENYDTASAKNVKVSRASFSGSTSGSGLDIITKGSVSLSDVTVDDNQAQGAVITAIYGTGNITIKRSTFDRNDTGGSSRGLEIDSHKNVTLDSVSASDNGGIGMDIDNCQVAGSVCVGSGNISMKSKKGVYNTFNNNGGIGLDISASGNVSLSNIQASGNDSSGVNVYNKYDGSSGKVTIGASSKMRNSFENNGFRGLQINSYGNISLKYVDVFGSAGNGAYITNGGAPSARSVKITECTFIKNIDHGLEIKSTGTVTLQGVESSDNSVYAGTLDFAGDGKQDVLSHTYEPDTWTFSGTNGAPFKIELNSDFFDAYLEVRDSSGALVFFDDEGGASGHNAYISDNLPATDTYTITVTSADGTGGGFYQLIFNTGSLDPIASFDGISINNTYGAGDVRIKHSPKAGYGVRAHDNNYNGLFIQSNGAVSVSSVETSGSRLNGVYVSNTSDAEKPVSLNTIIAEHFADDGVFISSRGNITLTRVTSLDNHDFGAYISNTSAVKERAVKVSSSTFSGTVGNDGLLIWSTGAVTLNGVSAENPDGRYGVWVKNTYGYGNVAISGKGNVFDNNGNTGLVIASYGDVSVSNFTARDNLGFGVQITNGFAGYTPTNIKVTASKNLNEVSGNSSSGLYISSYGTISINKVNVHDDTVHAELNNSSAPSVKKVSVTNSIFNNPAAAGLVINANGPVTLSSVNAFGNSGNGVYLDNRTTVGEDVIIKNSTFSGNGDHGIVVDSMGKVTVTNVNACGNNIGGGIGMIIENHDGIEGVTIDKGTFNGNINGLLVQSSGPVTLKSITAQDNGFDGIYVDGYSSGSTITVYKVHSAYNGTDGISLNNASGAVSITQSSSIGNGDSISDANGLYVYGSSTTVVTISKSTFMANFGSGIEFLSVGTHNLPNSSTFIFGNDLDGDGDLNFYDH